MDENTYETACKVADDWQAFADGIASVIVANSNLECDADETPVFAGVASVSLSGLEITVAFENGSVHNILVG